MEPTEAKSVMRLTGKELSVLLTPYQARKFVQGVSSTYTNANLVGVGIGYTTQKELWDKPGDVFTLSHVSQFTMSDETDGRSETRTDVKKKVKMTGPKEKLFYPQMRVLILKQPGESPDKATYITACYDQERVVFVSETGKCLYVFRSQILPEQDSAPTA